MRWLVLTFDGGGARIAGSGGMGDGDRPRRLLKPLAPRDGEPAACEPENEDRLDPGLLDVEGGFIEALLLIEPCAVTGVDGTDVEGVKGVAIE